MRPRYLAALFVCLALAAPARSAMAADPLKKPDDFRGMRWGAPPSSLPGLAAIDRDGDIVHYERAGEKKEIGGFPLHHVTYSFFKDQFYHAEIGYEGDGAFDALQKSLVDKYGPPDALREKTDPRGHPYEVATWNWPGHAFIGNRRDKDSPRGRVFYFYAPLTDASAKSQGIAPTAPQAKGGANTYLVQRGDSLERIAKRFGVTTADLTAANQGLTDKTLKAGATIAIPAAGAKAAPAGAGPGRGDVPPPPPSGAVIEYRVKDGDVLSKVANAHGARTRDVIAANPGVNPDALRPGTMLKIPVAQKDAPSTAASPPAAPQPAAPAENAPPPAAP